MFEYLEPEPNTPEGDTPGGNNTPGADSQPSMPPGGANRPGAQPPQPEKLRHMLYGSLAALDRTIKILHAYGYADPNDWSDPIPVPPTAAGAAGTSSPGATTWMVIMTKTVLLR